MWGIAPIPVQANDSSLNFSMPRSSNALVCGQRPRHAILRMPHKPSEHQDWFSGIVLNSPREVFWLFSSGDKVVRVLGSANETLVRTLLRWPCGIRSSTAIYCLARVDLLGRFCHTACKHVRSRGRVYIGVSTGTRLRICYHKIALSRVLLEGLPHSVHTFSSLISPQKTANSIDIIP
jgi:hypothetical protein